MIAKFDGQLEIDTERGVVYFHSSQTGHTLLRINRLPTPIPVTDDLLCFLDITHMHGVSWKIRMKHQEKSEDEIVDEIVETLRKKYSDFNQDCKQAIKKCLVHGCTNKTSEGTFVGDLCSPCHEMITTGKVRHGNTFINKMGDKVDVFQNRLKEIQMQAKGTLERWE